MKRKPNWVITVLMRLAIPFLSVLTISCSNTADYTIVGEIDSEESVDSIYLYHSDATSFASAPVKDGKFILKGRVNDVEKALLGNIKHQFASTIILENGQKYKFIFKNGKQQLQGGNIHNKVLGFTSSKEYTEALENYQKLFAELTENYDGSDKERGYEIENILTEAGELVSKIESTHFSKIIEGNEPAIVKLFALTETQDWENYPIEKRLNLLDVYEKELPENSLVNEYREYLSGEAEMIQAAEGVSTGKPYINIIAQNREKEVVNLSQVIAQNSYTLLEFWASWCGPCRGEIPHLKEAYQKYKAKGFEIYAISLDDKESDWLQALDEEKTPWINVWNTEGFNGELIKSYGIRGIPSSFLIDKNGNIIASMNQLRGEEMDKTLENLFQ